MSYIKPVIVAVGYNRPKSLKRLLNSIRDAYYNDSEVQLIISIDKSDNNEVIKIAEKFNWTHGKKLIRRFESKQGLREHILKCGDLSVEYEAAIILEDDLIVSPSFYLFTQAALDFYKEESKIVGISLYSPQVNGWAPRMFFPSLEGHDVFFGQFGVSWGQCWIKEQWVLWREWYEQHEGKLCYSNEVPSQVTKWPETSWGKYFTHYIVENNKYYVLPYNALSTTFSDRGQHTKIPTNKYQVPLLYGKKDYRFVNFKDGVKYDIYFERQGLEKYFQDKYRKAGICIDLYATKKEYGNCRYLLTTAVKPFKLVYTYGLKMKPHELNIVYSIEGYDIFLYDTSVKSDLKLNKNKRHYGYIKYDISTLNWKEACYFALLSLINRIFFYSKKK